MNGKKKLVVPLVAIMMCAVALAGVAYAYTTNVTYEDAGDPGSDIIVIELQKADGSAWSDVTLDDLIVLSSVKTVPAQGSPSVKVNAEQGIGFVGSVIVYNETSETKVKLSAPTSTITPSTITVNGAASGSIVISSVNVAFFTDEECEDDFDNVNGETAVSGGTTFYFKVTVTLSGTEAEHQIVFNNNGAYADAQAVQAAIANAVVALGITATSAAA